MNFEKSFVDISKVIVVMPGTVIIDLDNKEKDGNFVRYKVRNATRKLDKIVLAYVKPPKERCFKPDLVIEKNDFKRFKIYSPGY